MVDDVMSFHWKSALQATKEVNKVEISGLGRFDMRIKKALNKLALYERYKKVYEKKLETLATDSKEYNRYRLRLETITEEIKFLKEKVNEV